MSLLLIYSRYFIYISITYLCFTSATQASTKQVFNKFKHRLLQIQVVDISTGSKSSLGSGFFVSKDGLITTNYHVISKHVFEPEEYRIEYISENSKPRQARLVNLDVVHDLALLQADTSNTPYMTIQKKQLEKGERIYTLGNPHDLGMAIVEGTYNGLTDDTMHERIHLSSAINAGMSGGPSITSQGKVIGVNVATAGNQIGFLVPAKYLHNLIANKTVNKKPDFLKLINLQLKRNQDEYINNILKQPLKTKNLGKYKVPAKLASYLTCWGDSDNEEEPYKSSENFCSTKNDIFLDRNLAAGDIYYSHHYLQARDISRFRFYNILNGFFKSPRTGLKGSKENFSNFKCQTEFTQHINMKFKTVFCLRGYKKFSQLYDMVLSIVTLTENYKGIQSNLILSGVSYENAVHFSKTYLEAFSWNP